MVVSAVGTPQAPDQINIIAAIKEAGNIKVWITLHEYFFFLISYILLY